MLLAFMSISRNVSQRPMVSWDSLRLTARSGKEIVNGMLFRVLGNQKETTYFLGASHPLWFAQAKNAGFSESTPRRVRKETIQVPCVV